MQWTQVLQGSYVASFANFGRVLVSADSTQAVNEVVYSVNRGNQWQKVKFSNDDQLYLVNQIIALSSKTLTDASTGQAFERFLLVASDTKSKKIVMFLLDAVEEQHPSIASSGNVDLHDEPITNPECFKKCISFNNSQKVSKIY